MIGCLVVGLLVVIAFALTPWPLWPVLLIGLVVLFALATAFGLTKGILGAIFRR